MRKYCTSPIWSMVRMFSTALEFSQFLYKEKSPSASLHYICLSMPKSKHKVSLWSLPVSFNLSWSVETSSDCYCIPLLCANQLQCLHECVRKCSNWTLYTVHWPLAGLSDHHRTHSAKCLIAILRGIFKSCWNQVSMCNNLLGADQTNSARLQQKFLLPDTDLGNQQGNFSLVSLSWHPSIHQSCSQFQVCSIFSGPGLLLAEFNCSRRLVALFLECILGNAWILILLGIVVLFKGD